MDLNRIKKLAGLDTDSVQSPSQIREDVSGLTLTESSGASKDMASNMIKVIDKQIADCKKKLTRLGPSQQDMKDEITAILRDLEVERTEMVKLEKKYSEKKKSGDKIQENFSKEIFESDTLSTIEALHKQIIDIKVLIADTESTENIDKQTKEQKISSYKQTLDWLITKRKEKIKELEKEKAEKNQVSEETDMSPIDVLTTVIKNSDGRSVNLSESVNETISDIAVLGLEKVANVIDSGETVYHVYESKNNADLWFCTTDGTNTIKETSLKLKDLQAFDQSKSDD